jgi:hypothetical protein
VRFVALAWNALDRLVSANEGLAEFASALYLRSEVHFDALNSFYRLGTVPGIFPNLSL